MQCWRIPMIYTPMELPEGKRSVNTDKTRLCENHWKTYDFWPGPDWDSLKEFDEPQAKPQIDKIKRPDAPAFIPNREKALWWFGK